MEARLNVKGASPAPSTGPLSHVYWQGSKVALTPNPAGYHFKVSRMVIPPPTRAPRIVKFLKPYVLKMDMSNMYITAQVFHQPTATVAASATSQEVVLRSSMGNTHDVDAAGKIGKILAERLLLKHIPAVSVFLKREQRYHGKVKAVIDSLREAGMKVI